MNLKAVFGAASALALAATAQAHDPRSEARAPISRNESLDTTLEQQLQPALREFAAAWNAHDPQALAATFAEDAVLIDPFGRVARGRAEIEKLFEDEQRGMLKATQFSHRVTDVRRVAPGVAFLDEEITIRGVQDPSGQALPDMHIHGAMLLAKQRGKWQVVEGRPYALAPRPPPGVAAGAPSRTREESAATPSPPSRSGTGSGSTPGSESGTATGPAPGSESETGTGSTSGSESGTGTGSTTDRAQ